MALIIFLFLAPALLEAAQLPAIPSEDNWDPWTEWTQCSRSCGNGIRIRNRKCPGNSPEACRGPSLEVGSCEGSSSCPSWQKWGAWTECTATCGLGAQERARECSGTGCPGPARGFKQCDFGCPCPWSGWLPNSGATVAEWSRWTNWGSCSETCGNGVKRRCRECQPRGGRCPGQLSESQPCNEGWCEPDRPTTPTRPTRPDYSQGRFRQWSPWSPCSATCGFGMATRQRECDGQGCQGDRYDRKQCSGGPCQDGTRPDRPDMRPRPCGGPCPVRNGCFRQCGPSPTQPPTQPIQPQWSPWGSWERCSQTCGNGMRTRRRFCPGGNCFGNSVDQERCNDGECYLTPLPPIRQPSQWTPWAQWSQCTRSCGGGTSQRYRQCPQDVGIGCEGSRMEEKRCNEFRCADPVPPSELSTPAPEWTQWGYWSWCTASCNGGRRERLRQCLSYGARSCPGSDRETENCNQEPCPTAPVLTTPAPTWAQWGFWSWCSATCGGGRRDRSRQCLSYAAKTCPGEETESETCGREPCPRQVEATTPAPKWSNWGYWSWCSKSCEGGLTRRTRQCFSYSGRGCSGDEEEEKECNTNVPCPTPPPATWTSWGYWTLCSKTCGQGEKRRQRICIGQTGGSRDCQGDGSETRECTELASCPTAPPPIPARKAEWANWGNWGFCSKSCGGGVAERQRYCFGASSRDCPGDEMEEKDCNTNECPKPKFSNWGFWSVCSASCGGGMRIRQRQCMSYTGQGCDGEPEEKEECNRNECPTPPPAIWSSWGYWSRCSKTCDSGEKTRQRFCIGRSGSSGDCPGESSEATECRELDFCPTAPPPIPGRKPEWASWGGWSFCTKTCGGGVTERRRYCIGVSNDECGSEKSEERECNPEACPPPRTRPPLPATEPPFQTLPPRPATDPPRTQPPPTYTRQPVTQPPPVYTRQPVTQPPPIYTRQPVTQPPPVYTRPPVTQQPWTQSPSRTLPPWTARPSQPPQWSQWASWEPCSATCGPGIAERKRYCIYGPQTTTVPCPGGALERTRCNQGQCVSQPPQTLPPLTFPSYTFPPQTQRPYTYPPETQQPQTFPPYTYPPQTQRPQTFPPYTYPPQTQRPQTFPPYTYPPQTQPPVMASCNWSGWNQWTSCNGQQCQSQGLQARQRACPSCMGTCSGGPNQFRPCQSESCGAVQPQQPCATGGCPGGQAMSGQWPYLGQGYYREYTYPSASGQAGLYPIQPGISMSGGLNSANMFYQSGGAFSQAMSPIRRRNTQRK